MKKKFEKYKRKIGFLSIYTICFLVAVGMIIGIYVVQDASMVRFVDGMAQHLPVLGYIREYVRGIFSQGSIHLPMVDFSIGQGLDVIGTLNYYGFGDPLTLLTAFFPGKYLELAYGFLIFLRMYLSGLAFIGFCYTIGKRQKSAVLSGAMLYAFCNFALFAGFRHPLFLNGMLYLPLLLIGIERILKKKSIVFLAVTVALSFSTNYYFTYMGTILAGIYLLIRLLGSYRELGVKGFFKIVGRIAGAYCLGTALAGIILLPAVNAFLNNARNAGSPKALSPVYSPSTYIKMLKSLMVPNGSANSWMIPGVGVTGVFSVFTILVSRGKETKKFLAGVLVLGGMMCLPIAGKMMNGFSYVTNRWTYGCAFFLALAAVFALSKLKELTGKQRWEAVGLTFAFSGAVWGFQLMLGGKDSIYNKTLLVLGLTCLCFAAISYLYEKKHSRFLGAAVCGVTMIGILWNIQVLYHENYHDYARGGKFGRAEEWYDNASLRASDLIEDSAFYRVERPLEIYNSSLMYGEYGNSYYYSVVPETMKKFYLSLWLNGLERPYVMGGLNSRTALNALSGVKYYISKENKIVPYGYEEAGEVPLKNGHTSFLYENSYPLSLGCTYDSMMTEKTYNSLPPLVREQALLHYAVLEGSINGIPEETDISDYGITSAPVRVKSAEKVAYKKGKIKAKKKGVLTLEFQGKENCETYLILKGLKAEDGQRDGTPVMVRGSAGSSYIKLAGVENHSYIPIEGIAVNLGYSQKAQNQCILEFPVNRTYEVEELEVQFVPMDLYQKSVQERQQESLEQVQAGTNKITGKISASSDKILQFSIPYSDGWTAYVDGKEAETFISGIAYTGIYLEAGEHTILLKYSSPWIVPGCILSALGALGIVLYCVLRRRNKQFI